ncbi:hypothetical protein [Streptomyces sp. NPDC058579]|uniref:hypothetical protein n=1 Tax=Streptomyces sp. NPDC058579 TaxID=3346548 RepID=UPI003666F36D
MSSDVAPDPEEAPVPEVAPVPAEAVDSAGSGSPEADEAPAPFPASDDTTGSVGPERPEAPAAEGSEPEAPEGSGDRPEPDDEIPELELELKPYDDSVPYSAAYTAAPGAEQPDESSKNVSAPEAAAEPTAEAAPEAGVDGAGRPGAPETETAPEPAEAEATGPGESPAPPRAESREADAAPARASEAADGSATEPTAPTDAPEPPAPEADAEAAPERAEAAKPPAEVLHSAEEAPEPTAPIDAPEPQAEGPRDLPAHAENEADPVEAHEGRTPASEAEAAEPAGAGAKPGETGETALPGDGNGIRQDHEAEAEPTAEASEDEAERHDNSALRDGPSYQQEIDDQLGARGLDRSEHDKLRLTRTNELSEAQAREVVGVRDAIKLDEGRMVTKVIAPPTMQAYLDNATSLGEDPFNPGEFRGSIARGSDTVDLRSMDQLRDGLALDDGGAGWSPVPPGASEAYQLRFPAPHDMRANPSFGAVDDERLANHIASMADQSMGRAWRDPFLGTGYTGGGIPEWIAESTGFPDHAEIWRMHADGTEAAVGFFDKNEGRWKSP